MDRAFRWVADLLVRAAALHVAASLHEAAARIAAPMFRAYVQTAVPTSQTLPFRLSAAAATERADPCPPAPLGSLGQMGCGGRSAAQGCRGCEGPAPPLSTEDRSM